MKYVQEWKLEYQEDVVQLVQVKHWQFALEEIQTKVLVVTSKSLQEMEFNLKQWNK